MKIIWTDKDQFFADEYQEAWLSKQTAWWTPDGKIYVYLLFEGHNMWLKCVGSTVHESVEYILVKKLHLRKLLKPLRIWEVYCNVCHWFSNICEIITSLGFSIKNTNWKWQKWH